MKNDDQKKSNSAGSSEAEGGAEREAEQEIAKELNALSRALMNVHRSLLRFQKEVYEGLEGVPLTPYNVLNLSLTHPDFEWLRMLSTLIAKIDETVDEDGAVLADFQPEVTATLRAIFIDETQHVTFKNRFKLALASDPSLYLEFSELRKFLPK